MPYKDKRVAYLKMKHRRILWREAGLCIDCGRPVVEGRTRCGRHLHLDKRGLYRYRRSHPGKAAEMRAAQAQRRKDNGQCTKCGLYLDPDADAGKVNCQNCREELCNC